MAAKTIDTSFQLVDILGHTRAENGTILLQTGDVGTEFTESDKVEHWQTPGLNSTPPNPDPKKAATQAFVFRRGDGDICLATREIRGQTNAGNLGPGETMLYAAGADGTSQARIILKGDSSINLYTSATAGGPAMALMITPSTDTYSINNAAGAAITATPTSISITIGAAALTLNKDGTIQLIGTGAVQIDGTSIMLGAVGVPGVNSVLVGPSGILGVPSTKVTAQSA